jgi:hypothetical protein
MQKNSDTQKIFSTEKMLNFVEEKLVLPNGGHMPDSQIAYRAFMRNIRENLKKGTDIKDIKNMCVADQEEITTNTEKADKYNTPWYKGKLKAIEDILQIAA